MKQKSLKLNVAMNVIRTISTMIFPLITFPYTSRILGPDGTGSVSFAFSFVSYFVFFAGLGIPMYGIREIARVRDDKEKLSRTAQELFIINMLASVLVFILFLGVIYFNGKINQEKTLFFVVSFSIILTAIGMDWLFQGLEEYKYITIRSIVFSTISTIAIFVFIHSKEDYIISAAIGVCAALGSNVVNFYKVRHIIFRKTSEKRNYRQYFRPLLKVYLMNFVISLYIQLDTVMLGFLTTSTNVGYYASAMKLTKILLALVTSLGVVLLPRLSYHIANGNDREFSELLKKSLTIILFICIPIVAGLMLTSEDVIRVLAGNEYLPAKAAIVITAPVILMIGLSNIFGLQILYPLGKDNKVTLAVTLGAVTSIVLNLLLIPKLEHIGAAIATLAAETVVTIAMIFIVRKTYKINFPFKNLFKYMISVTFMVVILMLIQNYINILLYRLPIMIVIGAIIYFGTLLLLKESFIVELKNNFFKKVAHV